ncbi:MAG: CHC2 zinc finger domain-containing protein [Bacteroidales bacterium]|nr:CHC2 zinc finger domain-containing protein [Bacteroidales bacterium]
MFIPQEIVDRLNELPVEDVANKLGLEVIKHKARCFMHEDQHPSLSFYAKKNIFFCFVYNKGGGPIELVKVFNKGWTFQQSCVERKAKMFWHITKDSARQFAIFPLDSIKMWLIMMKTGIRILLSGKAKE